MKVNDFVEAYKRYGLWDLVTQEEALDAVNLLRLGKPLKGELAEKVIVKFPWVLEAERQLTDKLALAKEGIQYTFVIGSYRSGKSQLKEYLIHKAMGEKALVVGHDFGMRPDPNSFTASLLEAISQQVDKSDDRVAVLDLLDLMSSKDLRGNSLADALLLVRDIFGVINVHLDEFEKLRGDLLYKWLDLLTSIHDKMDKGLYMIFYMTGEDLERVQKDKRTERFSTFMKDRVAVSGSYRGYLPEGFGRIASLISIAKGRNFAHDELVFISEVIYMISDRLSKGSISEANTTMIDVIDPAAEFFSKFSLSALEREIAAMEKRFGKGYKKDAGLAFENFVKRVLERRMATGIQVEEDHYFVEYRPENLKCGRKESDGHILISKQLADTFREVARVPVEVKFSQAKGRVLSDWKKLAKCGLLGIIALEPDRKEEVLDIMRELKGYEGPYPALVVPYPTRLALLAGLSTKDEFSEGFDLMERLFLSVWNLDLLLYELVVGAKAMEDIQKVTTLREEPAEVIIAKTIIELLEEAKREKSLRVIKRGVRQQLKKNKKSMSDDTLDQYVEGLLTKLESADLISRGSKRYKGRQEPVVRKRNWDPVKARELLLH